MSTPCSSFQDAMWSNHLATRPWDDPLRDLEWTTLAMVGEAGELANEVKKIARDATSEAEIVERYQRILAEAGDVLIYLALIAKQVGCQLDTLIFRAHVQGQAWFDQRHASEDDQPCA